MSTTTEAGLSTDKLVEISQLVKRAGDEAVQLRIVERFLSEVERRLLKATPHVFDIERVRTALQILKSLTDADDIDECLEAEFRLDQEFHLWRELIIARDQKIETYHFRRLCDSTPYPLDDEIFVALASFYRTLEFTPATQSKFDLSVTRLFTRDAGRGRREMRSLRSDNLKRLNQLFGAQPTDDSGPVVSSAAIEGAVNAIDSFIDEALSLADFEDLVRANIFDRYRAFKRDLGTMFFEPEIIAAAVECNLVVGNVFNDVIAAADQTLSSSLTADVDLAGALHDAAPESRSHVNELFRVFFGETDRHENVSGDVDYLGKLLELSSPRSKSDAGSKNADNSAQGRIAPILRMLSEARPDEKLIAKQMERSEILRGIDPDDFLFSADGAPDVLCRRAFGVILWSIEFREKELRANAINEGSRSEATSLLSKAEALATKLQHEIEVSDELNENRLRAVLNALLDARLKLERAIVRFSSSSLDAATDLTGQTDNKPADPKREKANERLSLLWKVLAFMAVILAGFYLYSQGFFKELGSLIDRQ
jgi:hypothetical protein